jgi:hypothetical protein
MAMNSWSDPFSGLDNEKQRRESIPNALIRSSLFSVNRKPSSEVFVKRKISSLSNYEITYTGEELGQSDCQIFYCLLGLFRHGNRRQDGFVEVRISDLLDKLGVSSSGGSSYEWLWMHMERLKRAEISVKSQRYKYIGNLISEIEKNDANGTVAFIMNSKMAALSEDYTLIRLDRKIKISSLLGKWLHDFYSSHEYGIPMKLDVMRGLSGSSMDKHAFKRQIKKALDEVSSVGVIDGYSIEGETLSVMKLRKKKKEVRPEDVFG